MTIISLAQFAILLVSIVVQVVSAQDCTTDLECEAIYRKGSACLSSGQCSNPFLDGCLKQHKTHSKRNCNSDDEDEANCRTSPFHYPEIRVHNQNWEVAIFFSWILQISLMELLDVPVTVGLGDDTATSSFYSIKNEMPYSKKAYGWDALRKANEMGGNCLNTDEDCAHVLPDVWLGQQPIYDAEYNDGQLDYLDGNGQVGKVGWYIPTFTAARHPFAITHMGLSRDRHQVAKVFKRPTTWSDYCHEVSSNNCSMPDDVADKYPTEADMGKYFADGFSGHFRATAENNCTGAENNNTCTGHIVAPPCTWSSFLESQAYWNNIALKSSGSDPITGAYSYGEMIQIWSAANATKSDVIMWWFEPDSVLEQFRNTDAEFTKVYLPSPSSECQQARVKDRCNEDPLVRIGEQAGSCDNKAHVTKKAIAKILRDMTLKESAVDQSPAYHFVRNFNIDELEIGKMLLHYANGGKSGYAAREAVCGWIVNNTGYLESLIPPNHPKVFQYVLDDKRGVTIGAFFAGATALFYLLISTAITFKKRKAAVFVYSQVQFIFVVLFGLFLVGIGAILHGVEPNHVVCKLRVWLVSLGYTLELAPLIVKVTALNRLMRASRKMRRIKINLTHLYASVVMLSAIIAVYLIVWTSVDPPRATEIRLLEEDSSTVTSQYGCRSESGLWQTGYNLWEGTLILWCSVLAFQSRNAKAEFNESKSLGMMIYSHFIFTILRVIVSIVFANDEYTIALSNSYLLSVDVMMALTIYLLPKMVMKPQTVTQAQQNRSHFSHAVASIQSHINSHSQFNSHSQTDPQYRDRKESAQEVCISPEHSTVSKESTGSNGNSNSNTTRTELDMDDDGVTSIGSGAIVEAPRRRGRRNPRTSLSIFYKDVGSDSPQLPSSLVSESSGQQRVKFKVDEDNDKLVVELLKKNQELSELKAVIISLQKARDDQDSKLERLSDRFGSKRVSAVLEAADEDT